MTREELRMSYKVGVIGAAGYAGAELVRLLLQHPEFDLTVITSNADAGTALADAYPAFAGASDLAFTTHDDPAVRECDLVFLAVPAHRGHVAGAGAARRRRDGRGPLRRLPPV